MLVSKNPELFNFAVFLSAWVNPKPKTIRMYCSLAGLSAKMLHWRWLVQFQGKYWNYTKKQADNMAEYSKQITPLVYHSFFSNTLDLSKLPEYQAVTIPMLAICGSKEVRDMKTSLTLLAQNPNCQTMTLQCVTPSNLIQCLKNLYWSVYETRNRMDTLSCLWK